MDAFFKIKERNSSVSDEVIGGVTTFLAMAYIVAVNPGLMEAAGIPFTAALTSTCLGAAIMTIAMGLIANRPIALASGMGINAIVAYTLCLGEVGVDWRVAMSVIFLEGIVILLLVLCGLRKAIMDAIPVDLRRAIGIGIGLFIAFIGLKGGGLIAADESTILALGELSSPTCIVALVSILVAVVLQVLERVDIPVAADHLIRARAAGAVDIVQVVAVQERAAVLLFNVNELQCGSPLWS